MTKKLSGLSERVGIWFLAALLLTLPFWLHWDFLQQPAYAVLYDYHAIALHATDLFLAVALGGWLFSRILGQSRTRLQWGAPFLTVPLLGLLVLGTIGLPLAVDPLYTAYLLARLILLFALYLVLVNVPLKQETIGWPLAAGMAVQAAVGVPQFLLGHTLGLWPLGETAIAAAWPGASVVMVGEQRWLRAYGLTQHPNVLGGLLMAGLCVVTGFYLIQSGARRTALLALLAAGLGTLLLTFSRAAWLGVALGGLVMVWLLFWARRRGAPPVRRSSLVLLAAVFLVVLLAFAAVNWPLLRPRLGLTSQGVEIRSVEERVMLNKAALVLIQMRPWLGVGLGNFPAALYRLAPDTVSVYPSFAPVHNLLLLTTAELGLLGGLLWLCLIVSPWVALWLRRRQIEMTPWWAGLSGALAALTVVGFFDHYLWSFQQGRLVLWLVWGLWAREWARSSSSRRRQESAQEPGP